MVVGIECELRSYRIGRAGNRGAEIILNDNRWIDGGWLGSRGGSNCGGGRERECLLLGVLRWRGAPRSDRLR